MSEEQQKGYIIYNEGNIPTLLIICRNCEYRLATMALTKSTHLNDFVLELRCGQCDLVSKIFSKEMR